MVRLTADLIAAAPSFLNPLKDRELDLRGHKIPVLENLGVTRDQNDAIDLTDNEIRHLGNLPKLPRLKMLLLGRNRIASLADSLATGIPNLERLVLTQNLLQSLSDLEPLAQLKRLCFLVLQGNPVTQQQHYRSWIIWRCPSLRILDYAKVKQSERTAARELFGSSLEDMTPLAAQIAGTKSNTFDVGGETAMGRMSEAERQRIHRAILSATTMQEVVKLENMLAEGRLPDRDTVMSH
ncbi:leucine-rich repeat-domain-containing protein [Protomyces lactucae-debilis]|uniref:U2 small nuclear ribonucleoprotein A' n=1 Tax=Protomyces lactucae-debilis TaxID=2754530 RepID=A0A1Y2FC44_PROLT|nr:leucine-rich repeat-domain-containing protein [Protomyces lactucae-debilis]ORY81471.1 leucine-rich repeat-domain-containing protein [Protomyces lactucae-debilis]